METKEKIHPPYTETKAHQIFRSLSLCHPPLLAIDSIARCRAPSRANAVSQQDTTDDYSIVVTIALRRLRMHQTKKQRTHSNFHCSLDIVFFYINITCQISKIHINLKCSFYMLKYMCYYLI